MCDLVLISNSSLNINIDAIYTPVLQLSGGEKQRVALARTFLKAPAIL